MTEYTYTKAPRPTQLRDLEWAIEELRGNHVVFIRCVTCDRILALEDAIREAAHGPVGLLPGSYFSTEQQCVSCPHCAEHFYANLTGLMREARKIQSTLDKEQQEQLEKLKHELQSNIALPELGLMVDPMTGAITPLFDDDEFDEEVEDYS